MLTIAVLNQKGGAGKSTIAANVAAAAHLAGRRTTLLDLDVQGSALDWQGARKPGSPLAGLTVTRADKVTLTASKLCELADGADVVVCDGPPRIDKVALAAAVLADVVVIPLRAGGPDWWALTQTLRLMQQAEVDRQGTGRAPMRRIYVVNFAPLRGAVAAHAIEGLTAIDAEAAKLIVRNHGAFDEAAHAGEAVLSMHPKSSAAHEIRRLYAVIAPDSSSPALLLGDRTCP
jgi:chromosome partitioning protein